MIFETSHYVVYAIFTLLEEFFIYICSIMFSRRVFICDLALVLVYNNESPYKQ